jgi:hypothetical protein
VHARFLKIIPTPPFKEIFLVVGGKIGAAGNNSAISILPQSTEIPNVDRPDERNGYAHFCWNSVAQSASEQRNAG